VPSLAPPAELLRALSGALAVLDVGWYVFGAQAVLFWGRPRFTEDIDVTVHLGSLDTSQLIGCLQDAGFTLRVEGTPAFVAQTRVVPLTFGNTGWALDAVLGGPGLEEAFLQRAVHVDVAPGLSVPVISAEDLVVTKVLAGRPKDLDMKMLKLFDRCRLFEVVKEARRCIDQFAVCLEGHRRDFGHGFAPRFVARVFVLWALDTGFNHR
jgi:hypothetical protein